MSRNFDIEETLCSLIILTNLSVKHISVLSHWIILIQWNSFHPSHSSLFLRIVFFHFPSRIWQTSQDSIQWKTNITWKTDDLKIPFLRKKITSHTWCTENGGTCEWTNHEMNFNQIVAHSKWIKTKSNQQPMNVDQKKDNNENVWIYFEHLKTRTKVENCCSLVKKRFCLHP